MKTFKNIILLLCALFLLNNGMASAKDANYSGTWVLDKEKSTLSDRWSQALVSATLTITHKGDDLKIKSEQEYTQRDRSDEMELKIGGDQVERETMGGRGNIKSKAMLSKDKKNLIIVSDIKFSGNRGTFTMTSTDTYSLSKDGKMLTVESKTETEEWGTRERTMVYMKK